MPPATGLHALCNTRVNASLSREQSPFGNSSQNLAPCLVMERNYTEHGMLSIFGQETAPVPVNETCDKIFVRRSVSGHHYVIPCEGGVCEHEGVGGLPRFCRSAASILRHLA
jgi:hypothetical protein